MDRADKPVIWMHNGRYFCCWADGQGYVGVGNTVLEAYWSWRQWHHPRGS